MTIQTDQSVPASQRISKAVVMQMIPDKQINKVRDHRYRTRPRRFKSVTVTLWSDKDRIPSELAYQFAGFLDGKGFIGECEAEVSICHDHGVITGIQAVKACVSTQSVMFGYSGRGNSCQLVMRFNSNAHFLRACEQVQLKPVDQATKSNSVDGSKSELQVIGCGELKFFKNWDDRTLRAVISNLVAFSNEETTSLDGEPFIRMDAVNPIILKTFGFQVEVGGEIDINLRRSAAQLARVPLMKNGFLKYAKRDKVEGFIIATEKEFVPPVPRSKAGPIPPPVTKVQTTGDPFTEHLNFSRELKDKHERFGVVETELELIKLEDDEAQKQIDELTTQIAARAARRSELKKEYETLKSASEQFLELQRIFNG